MRVVDLSHTIVSGMAQYPGDEVTPRLVRKQTHAVDGFLSTLLELGCHVGTHIDTPYHFLDGQPGLEAIPLTAFQGRALVVDAPARHEPGPVQVEVLAGVDLPATDYLIFRTGWERHWGADRYYACWPYLAPELARQLVDAELKGVGLDTPSKCPNFDNGDGTCHKLRTSPRLSGTRDDQPQWQSKRLPSPQRSLAGDPAPGLPAGWPGLLSRVSGAGTAARPRSRAGDSRGACRLRRSRPDPRSRPPARTERPRPPVVLRDRGAGPRTATSGRESPSGSAWRLRSGTWLNTADASRSV